MLARVLAAVAEAGVRIVVGPAGLVLPSEVVRTREEPPGGGPVPALAAGLAALQRVGDPGQRWPVVALLAADLPLLTASAVHALRAALTDPPEGAGVPDGVVFVDETGRRQHLCGVWRTEPLRRRLADLAQQRGDLAGVALRDLLGALRVAEIRVAEIRATGREPARVPWYDCDTEADVQRAQELIMERDLAEWVNVVRTELRLGPVDQALVLDLARDVAHEVMRPAAPVTAYLLGLAVGQGADPAEAARIVTDLAAHWAAGTPAGGGSAD